MAHDPIRELVDDRREFVARLAVETKRGQLRYMDDPTPSQSGLFRLLGRPALREVVLYKPRQVRWSQTIAADRFQRFFAATEPLRTLYVTNHGDTTRSIFGKLRTFLNGLPDGVRRWNPAKVNLTERTIESSHGARLDLITAGGSSHGRGWTYQALVAEELAFWPNDEEVHAAVTQTIDAEAPIIYVSTADGPHGLFYRKVIAAREAQRRGDPGVAFHFERWCDHGEYRMEPPADWEMDDEEADLEATYGLDRAQLYWRHQKIHGVRGIGPQRFRREYPLVEDDGFVVVDGSWFDVDYLSAVKASLPEPVVGACRIYRPPERGMTYAAGVDPSWCNGGDDAVCVILDARGATAAVLAMNEGGEDLFGERASDLCHRYNHARALVETNPGGAGTRVLGIMLDNNVPMWRENPGEDPPRYWTTSHGSKSEAFAYARQAVNGDCYELLDHTIIEQLMAIRELPRPSGMSKIEGKGGMKDDHAMAFVLAAWNHQTIAEPYAQPFPGRRRRRYVARQAPMAAVRQALGSGGGRMGP